MSQAMPPGAAIIINGTALTSAQAEVLRCAVVDALYYLRDNPKAFGTDAHGKAMHRLTWERLGEVQDLMHSHMTGAPE